MKEYKIVREFEERLRGNIPDEELEEILKELRMKKFLTGSIRNLSLQKVLFIAANINLTKTPLRKKLERKCREKGTVPTLANLIQAMSTKDIQEILSCNQRTAKDYQMLFRHLTWILL